MRTRRLLLGAVALVVLFGARPLRAAVQVYSPNRNFIVTAPTREVAEEFARKAEVYRREKALEWVGREMPPWPQPCPLIVKPTPSGPGGATKFDYNGSGGYAVMSMEITGDLERMLNSVLPHEVTHTVFADHFRYPVPRWADEGGSVLSEDDRERSQHDHLCRDLLNRQQKFPLRRLFNLKEYHELNGVPAGVMVLYAEGYSVTNYLVGLAGRGVFLNFVAIGMRGSWDQAVQTCYHLQSVEQLEEGWLEHLRATRKGAPIQLAQNTQPARPTVELTNREMLRRTVPPAQPQLDPVPVMRGQADDEGWGQRPANRPTYLPAALPVAVPSSPPSFPPPVTLPPVQLGPPLFGPGPSR